MTVKQPFKDDTPTLALRHGPFNYGAIWIDNSRKSATCVVCLKRITGGSDRVNIQVRRSQSVQFNNGGMSVQAKILMHVTCLQEFLAGGSTARNPFDCLDCGSKAHEVSSSAARSQLTRNGRICIGCIDTGRWMICKSCGYYTQKYRMSRIVAKNVAIQGRPTVDMFSYDEEHYVCDACMRPGALGSQMFITRKMLGKAIKQDEELLKKVEEIKQDPGLDV